MKILIRATNWVGDAIMALPALRAVRGRFPEAEIAILALPYIADIYRDQQVCNSLITYDRKGAHETFSGRERLAGELRAQKFDIALLLQNAFDAAWIAWRAGIPQRIGYARDARTLLLTKSIAVPKSGVIPAHEKFYYLELLRRAGWIEGLPEESTITLNVPEQRRQRAAEFLVASGARPETAGNHPHPRSLGRYHRDAARALDRPGHHALFYGRLRPGPRSPRTRILTRLRRCADIQHRGTGARSGGNRA